MSGIKIPNFRFLEIFVNSFNKLNKIFHILKRRLLNNNVKSLRGDVRFFNYTFSILFFDIFSGKCFTKMKGSTTQKNKMRMKFLKIWFLSNVNDNIVICFGFK